MPTKPLRQTATISGASAEVTLPNTEGRPPIGRSPWVPLVAYLLTLEALNKLSLPRKEIGGSRAPRMLLLLLLPLLYPASASEQKAPFLTSSERERRGERAMSTGAANSSDSKVETISRLAQWRIESFGPCSYRRSESFKLGIWNWYLTIEKNRYMYIRLFPEPCRVSKEQPPFARFVVRVSSPGPNRRCFVSSVVDRVLRTSEDFVWPVDYVFQGRFTVDVEFLDLKIASLNSGDPHPLWSTEGLLKSVLSKTSLQCLSRMLQDGIHADVTIKTSNGFLKAHKAILASSSPVFESMFLHDLREKESSTIEIEDMSLEACSALLGFIYGAIEQEEFWKHRIALLGAADKYDIADLKDCCEESLLDDINTSNVLERLHEAWLYQLNKLKKGCLLYLFDFGKIYDVKDEINTFFQHVDRELMVEMFQEILTAWKPA